MPLVRSKLGILIVGLIIRFDGNFPMNRMGPLQLIVKNLNILMTCAKS